MQKSTNNVDQAEVERFAALASKWWDTEGELRPLHDINPLRMGFIESHSELEGKLVLDVGCGGGILSESLARRGAIVTGIDVNEEALSVARQHAEQGHLKIDYEKATVERLAAKGTHQFDVIMCMELLEHVPDPSSIVKACAELVEPGGAVFFTTLNRTVMSYLKAIVAAEYVMHYLPIGTHTWEKFIRPSELDGWGRTAGLSLEDLKGMSYNPFTKEYKLCDNVDVNYLAFYTDGTP